MVVLWYLFLFSLLFISISVLYKILLIYFAKKKKNRKHHNFYLNCFWLTKSKDLSEYKVIIFIFLWINTINVILF